MFVSSYEQGTCEGTPALDSSSSAASSSLAFVLAATTTAHRAEADRGKGVSMRMCVCVYLLSLLLRGQRSYDHVASKSIVTIRLYP